MTDIIFFTTLATQCFLQWWLIARQRHAIRAHRHQVPRPFATTISLTAHQHAADYTLARLQVQKLSVVLETLMILVWLILGGLNQWQLFLKAHMNVGLLYGLTLIGGIMLVQAILKLPVEIYHHFFLEKKFGFNRMSVRLFLTDTLRHMLLGLVLGLPLFSIVLCLFASAGHTAWLWIWLFWIAFNLALMVIVPKWILPLYNRFTPLADNNLRVRIEALLKRCGFFSRGVFVMDASRRSGHSNAFFTGYGAGKRIVFFDTLLSKLTPDEIEAVLAHELGHFHHRHLLRHFATTVVISGVCLFLLSFLMQQTWFYQAFHLENTGRDPALALTVFMLIFPVLQFFLQPLQAYFSRKNEFQADAFAVKYSRAQDLISALVKLYESNATSLSADHLYTRFYASHPPALERITRLQSLSDAHE